MVWQFKNKMPVFSPLFSQILSGMSELNTIDEFDSLTGAHERIHKILHDRGLQIV